MINLSNSGSSATLASDVLASSTADVILRFMPPPPPSLISRLYSRFLGRSPRKRLGVEVGVFVETEDGRRTILDPLQPAFQLGHRGALTDFPWVVHGGGRHHDGNVIHLSRANIDKISRITVYAFSMASEVQWDHELLHLIVEAGETERIAVRMSSDFGPHRVCALASLSMDRSRGLEVTRLMTFHAGHNTCDEHYDWGFSWTECHG